MSPSEQRRAISRSRKAFAFFSETGKAGTEQVYNGCPEKFQTEAIGWYDRLGLVLYKFPALSYSFTEPWNHLNS
jgi:hypothetical protein